jgi:hypothetical protein
MPTVVRDRTTRASLTLMPLAEPSPTPTPSPTPSPSPSAQLGIDRSSYDFGTVTQSTSSGPISFLITNAGPGSSGTVSTSVTGDASAFSVSGCDGQVLAPSGSCMLQVSFAPSAVGSFHITVSVNATPGGSVTTDITGVAVAPTLIAITPSPAAYGALLDGVTAPQMFTVTNGGTQATGTLTTAVTGSDAAQFVPSADNCNGHTLAPSASCTLQLTFTPSGATGNRAASLTLTGTPGGTAVSTLSGRALTAASVGFAASTHDFGTLDVGMTTAPVDFVVTNSGGQTTGTLTTQLTGSTADFVVDMDACNGQTLGYLATCTIRGHFAPASYGPKSLTVAVNGSPGGTASMTWTGVGHDTVTLTVMTPFGGNGGGGDVATSGINCPTGVCSIVVDRSGASPPPFTLTATPHVDSTFGSWSGDCSGTNPVCMLAMTANKSVTPSFMRKHFTLSVMPNHIAGASGTVTSVTTPAEATEIACGSTCSLERFYNDMVTLTASPAPGYYFGGWGGDCASASTNTTCSLTMTAARSATPTFTPANIIFTTAATYTQAQVQAMGTGPDPTSKMLSGADAICLAAAKTLIPSPTPSPAGWHAVIGATNPSLYAQTRLLANNPNPRGWVRPDGKPFGDTFSSIFTAFGVIWYPPRITEANTQPGLAATERSWTGCDRYGQQNTSFGVSTCGDWGDSSTNTFSAGYAAAGSVEWVEGDLFQMNAATGAAGCNSSLHLLCMQTDYYAIVPPPMPSPAGSRRIFLSDAVVVPTANGVTDFDAYCTNNGPGGTFKALVAPTGSTAASRFASPAPRSVPIVRMDGVVVSTTDTAFFAGGAPAAPINVTQSKAYTGWIIFGEAMWVATGASAVNVNGASTCANWTSSSGTGTSGVASNPIMWFDSDTTLGGQEACNNLRLYCLEQ